MTFFQQESGLPLLKAQPKRILTSFAIPAHGALKHRYKCSAGFTPICSRVLKKPSSHVKACRTTTFLQGQELLERNQGAPSRQWARAATLEASRPYYASLSPAGRSRREVSVHGQPLYTTTRDATQCCSHERRTQRRHTPFLATLAWILTVVAPGRLYRLGLVAPARGTVSPMPRVSSLTSSLSSSCCCPAMKTKCSTEY